MSVIIKIITMVLVFNLALAAIDYDNTLPVQVIELQQNEKRTIDNINRMLRDPGWRHIGLGKRSRPRALANGKSWAMIGLGR